MWNSVDMSQWLLINLQVMQLPWMLHNEVHVGEGVGWGFHAEVMN
jgi:hypothetical protein